MKTLGNWQKQKESSRDGSASEYEQRAEKRGAPLLSKSTVHTKNLGGFLKHDWNIS